MKEKAGVFEGSGADVVAGAAAKGDDASGFEKIEGAELAADTGCDGAKDGVDVGFDGAKGLLNGELGLERLSCFVEVAVSEPPVADSALANGLGGAVELVPLGAAGAENMELLDAAGGGVCSVDFAASAKLLNGDVAKGEAEAEVCAVG